MKISIQLIFCFDFEVNLRSVFPHMKKRNFWLEKYFLPVSILEFVRTDGQGIDKFSKQSFWAHKCTVTDKEKKHHKLTIA